MAVWLLLTGTAMAQHQHAESPPPQRAVAKSEHLVLRDGKMMYSLNGQEMQLQQPLTLKNGTVIHPNGTYVLKNGKQRVLRIGQCLDLKGKVYDSEQVFLRQNRRTQNGDSGNVPGTLMGGPGHHH